MRKTSIVLLLIISCLFISSESFLDKYDIGKATDVLQSFYSKTSISFLDLISKNRPDKYVEIKATIESIDTIISNTIVDINSYTSKYTEWDTTIEKFVNQIQDLKIEDKHEK